jgi:hypothetical protein
LSATESDNRPRQDAGLVALYRRMKNGVDGQPAGDQSCSILKALDALVQYRNAVFGHGGPRYESFFTNVYAEVDLEIGGAAFPVRAQGITDRCTVAPAANARLRLLWCVGWVRDQNRRRATEVAARLPVIARGTPAVSECHALGWQVTRLLRPDLAMEAMGELGFLGRGWPSLLADGISCGTFPYSDMEAPHEAQVVRGMPFKSGPQVRTTLVLAWANR